LSRQTHDFIVLLIQLMIATAVLVGGGTMVWNAIGPVVKSQLAKPIPG
jgi:hypothetical protein